MNRLIKYILTLSLSFSGIGLYAQETTYDESAGYLDQYLETAAQNNPKLKAVFNEYLAALEEAPQVSSLPDPQLAFGYFIQPVETRVGAQRANLSVSQMFPWFGTLAAQKNVAVQKAKAKYEIFIDEKLKLFNDVKETYNNLYYINKAIVVTNENLQLLASFKQLAQINFEGGKSGFANVLKVEMEEQTLKNQLKHLQDKKAPLYARFRQLLNVENLNEVNFPEILWVEEIEMNTQRIYKTILAQNPDLKRLDFQSMAFEDQVKVAKKMGMPSFNVGMGYVNVAERIDMELPDNGKDVFMFPQVGIKVPLYRKKYKAMEKEARLKKEAVDFQTENRKNELFTQLEKIHTEYLDAARRVDLYDSLVDLSERTIELLQSEFTTGITDFQELLDMDRKLLNYSLELEKARAERNTYVYQIEYLMGENETN